MSTFLPWYTSQGSFGVIGTYGTTWEVIWDAPRIRASTAFYHLSWEGSGNAFNVFTSYKSMSAPEVHQVWNLPFFNGDNIHSTTAYVFGGGKGYKNAVQSYTIWASFNVAMATFEGTSTDREKPELVSNAMATLNILPKKGVVVYDATTGEIKHLHRVTAFSIEQLPENALIEADALTFNQQFNRDSFPAAVLFINLDTLDEKTSYKVDLATGMLQALPVNSTALSH